MPDHRRLPLISAALFLATAALYWPALRFDFINLDDPTYILQNPKVSQGLTWGGAVWAFTDFFGANWHPLTWLSHMVDVELYGLRPAGHHLTNLLFHAANTVLLLVLLKHLTGSLWRSAVVAALFGLHPTHVESVAWVAERKDVLSTFFGLLSLLAYASHARSATKSKVADVTRSQLPNPNSQLLTPNFHFLRSRAYWLTGLFLALGLMSKPMLVTWPFVMLLLDFWPLGRATKADGKGKTKTTPHPTLSPNEAERAGRRWLQLVIEKLPFFAMTLGSCVLTFLAQRAGGAVQSMDRLPLMARLENAVVSYARYLGKTFWPADLSAYYPHPLVWPDGVVLGAVLLIGGIFVLGLWKMRRQPYLIVGVSWFLGTLVPVIGLIQVGGQSIADRYLYIPQIGILAALVWGVTELVANHPRARQIAIGVSLGVIIACGVVTRQYLPKWQNSIALFKHALTVNAENPPALYSLGLALSEQGKHDEAITYLLKAVALDPNIQIYQGQLALELETQGDITGAIERYRRCIELSPNLTEALNNLAWILATSPDAKHRNGADAVRFATRACQLTQYDWPMFLGTLAASYAEAGRFPEAIQTAEKAEQKARARGFVELADRNAALLKTYRASQPHRETAPTP